MSIFEYLPLRNALETTMSRTLKREWRIQWMKDLIDVACHPCALISDGGATVFTKFSAAPDAAQQFELEFQGLQYLSGNAGVQIPKPIGIVLVEGGALFIMQALDEIERGPLQYRQIGQTLAKIHSVKSEQFGFMIDNHIGPLNQDNTLSGNWAEFYARQRLAPRLKEAADSGGLPPEVIRRVEKLIEMVPELSGPEPTPTLLHGDAQLNNYLSTTQGVFVIDPAVYFGHPEIDLAILGAWQPAPEEVFEGYRETQPIDPGFADRCDLWRVHLYLAAVTVEGPAHLPRLAGALARYV